MDNAIQICVAALAKKFAAAALSDGCKHTAAWCIGQLPPLYAKFRQTSESRYGVEIARLVQGVLKELASSQQTHPEAQKLAVAMATRLHLLHEQLGIPGLNLKLLGPPARSRKAS